MKVLVTGANGQLGRHMRLLVEGNAPDAVAPSTQHEYHFTDIEELDITRRDAVFNYVLRQGITLVVNCAAYTNVDRAEEEESVADMVNHLAVRHLADAMKVNGGTLIHVSTDYVFGGGMHNRPCAEDAAVNPTGAYGRTKLAGERAIGEVGCHHLILRTAWLYSEFGNNFVKTMLRIMSQRECCQVVFDQVGTPTYAGDLARAIFDIVEHERFRGNEGIYHFSNEGVCSWFDFAKEIARQSGITSCNIAPCHSNEFPSKVDRPPFSVLDKSKFKRTFGTTIPYWTDSLAVCLSNLQQDNQTTR